MKPQKPGLFRYLSSFFVSYVVERAESAHSPVLEVVYSAGRYVLHSDKANYSFGELHKAFRDVFREVDIARQPLRKALVLGLGAGSVPNLLAELGQQPQMIGVELDPVVIELGKRYFGLDEYKNLLIIQDEAGAYMEQNDDVFDFIAVDVFVDENVPAHLDTLGFLQNLKRALAPDGLLIFNRVVATQDTKQRTENFLPLFEVVFPGYSIHRVLSNYMLVFDRRKAG